MCAVADWASLPPDVCQKILSTYEETLRDGAGVCKAWNSVANADGLGPVNLDVHCEYKDDEETAADWINSKLAKFVTPHLKVLTVTYEGILGNPDETYASMLRVLGYKGSPLCTQMHFGISWLADWSVLDILPKTVQELSLCSLHLQRFDRTNTDRPSLQAFNTLVNLVELELIFQGNFEEVPDYNMVVEGDLVLPSLQFLQLHREDIPVMLQDGDYSPVVLSQFTGTQIPQECLVICNEFIQTQSKQVWTECCWYDDKFPFPLEKVFGLA